MAKRGPKPKLKTFVPILQTWEAPAHLPPAARAEFDRIADLLRQRGTIDRTDVTLVIRRAELCELAEASFKQIAADGAFLESDRGNLGAHPAVKVHAAAVAGIVKIDSELELTPALTKPVAGAANTSGYGAWAKHLGGS